MTNKTTKVLDPRVTLNIKFLAVLKQMTRKVDDSLFATGALR
jgi:hypothetical protein